MNQIQLKPIHEQIVAVIGASSGIGRLTALELAKKGAKLVVSARSLSGLSSLADEISQLGGEVIAVSADVSSFEQVEAIAAKTVEHYGRLDTWIHLAATSVFAPFEQVTPAEFQRVIDVNLMGQVYGAMAALFGYSHLFGGYAGGQAEYARVPFADVGPIKIPEGLTDDQVLFLSDILPTGYMAAENCNIQPGDTVAVWGCGPVGQFVIKSAFLLGAERVIAIDRIPERLKMAQEYGNAEIINYEEVDTGEALKEMTGGRGPDACVDAVGLEAHGIGLEGFKYLRPLLERIQKGEISPDRIITHHLPLTEAPHGYDIFKEKKENCIKVVLKP